MRVKVGNTWHEATIDEPIMVELTEADKNNIARMHPEATKYAEFHDSMDMTRAQRFDWMEASIHEDEEWQLVEKPSDSNPAPVPKSKYVLHLYKKRATAVSPTPVKLESEIYFRGLFLEDGVNSNKRFMIGMRWDEVNVHGYTSAASFLNAHHELYSIVMQHTKPDTIFYYWE